MLLVARAGTWLMSAGVTGYVTEMLRVMLRYGLFNLYVRVAAVLRPIKSEPAAWGYMYVPKLNQDMKSGRQNT